MKTRILILAKANGLNQNLLRLGLSHPEWEVRFSEKPDESPGGAISHWVVDDACHPDLKKFLKAHPPPRSLKGLLYLVKREKPGFQSIKSPVPLRILVKPFDPRSLRAIIGQDFNSHEP